MAKELQPSRYDVGAIVRDYTRSIIGVSPNLATPATWIEVPGADGERQPSKR